MEPRKQMSVGAGASRVALGTLVILLVLTPGGDIRLWWVYFLIAAGAGVLAYVGLFMALRRRQQP
ncbi:hypothetical protein ACTMTU_26450 [Streptomyces sp. OZ13]|jgi:hypothetical protein|uniref:hypothetical protein n=1 Tax=Streptomyces sp. OZ13 TaxID=3452210 RepID=UPI003F8CA10F